MSNTREMMRKFTIALNNITEAYCSDTTTAGVKESELWLLYALESESAHSQKQLCEEWGFTKTTLNTTIKQAQAAGHLTLTPIPGKRREMQIHLTESGKAYAAHVLRVIHQAEDQAMHETAKRYSTEFIDALEYFSSCLKAAFAQHVADPEKKT